MDLRKNAIASDHKITNLISYYRHHSIRDFVMGDDKRLKNFVIEDFEGLLKHLEDVIENKPINLDDIPF